MMTTRETIALAGIAISALFSIGGFLLTLYFVVFRMGRWMGRMDEFKKNVIADISFIRRHLFSNTGGSWRPHTELAAAAESERARKK